MKKMKKNLLLESALKLPRAIKRLLVCAMDLVIFFFLSWVAYWLRLGEFIDLSISSPWQEGIIKTFLISVFLGLPIFIAFGLYNSVFRYSGSGALLNIAKAFSVYGFGFALVVTFFGVDGIPRTIGIIQPILVFIAISLSRAFAKLSLSGQLLNFFKQRTRHRALIYGAGHSGFQLSAALSFSFEVSIIGFIDDDPHLSGRKLNGYLVYDPKLLEQTIRDRKIKYILLAMPNISRSRRKEIIKSLQKYPVAVHILPNMSDMARGRVSFSDLRDLAVEDLLDRAVVPADKDLMKKNIFGKTVVVTGAGGSIGSELVRQVIDNKPSKLILIEQNEYFLYQVHEELKNKALDSDVEMFPVLGSVQDQVRIKHIMRTWSPDTVYHAAAYKHVPLVEHNMTEGLKNNLFGTLCLAQLSIEHGVKNFVLISTDKAVRPTNIMGASKRLAELVLQGLAENQSHINFSMVRFGNVLGSSGSVVPRFRKQIKQGGPVTITHKEVTRFFMTISEAVELVIQAGSMSDGGDVFVLDMGTPVKIADLARSVIELTGLSVKSDDNPRGDIEIAVTGLRPGEKLYEELLLAGDFSSTQHPRILKAKEAFVPWEHLQPSLVALKTAMDSNDLGHITKILGGLVDGYVINEKTVDWTLLHPDFY
jgi:FlaA1/EpsC-like NDP-sugar epimerase